MSRCRAFNETWKHRCIKNARHRGYHKIEMPHAGRMRGYLDEGHEWRQV